MASSARCLPEGAPSPVAEGYGSPEGCNGRCLAGIAIESVRTALADEQAIAVLGHPAGAGEMGVMDMARTIRIMTASRQSAPSVAASSRRM